MNIIDISGKWICKYEDGTVIKEVRLPGSACENGIGTPQEYFEDYSKEAVRAPLERYSYIGKLYYEREIELPQEAEGQYVSVYFERVNIASKLWVDGVQMGRGIIDPVSPHVYNLTDRVNKKAELLVPVQAGKHTLRLEVDNSDQVLIGDMSSAYSLDTQGLWNGVIGRMEIHIEPIVHIQSVHVFPEKDSLRLETVTVSDRHKPMQIRKGILTYRLIKPCGCALEPVEQEIEVFTTRQRNYFELPLAEADKVFWNEFHPDLYTLEVTLSCDGMVSTYSQPFGYRMLSVEDKRFMINGRQMPLRGTINCAQYPVTGYPPMDKETWKEHFRIYKDYGLNHVRCHAWCPPEAAFAAADEVGLYLSVEMPLWLNRGICGTEVGDDEWHEPFYHRCGLKMLESFGNHPSFVMFPNGNENMGDFALLDELSRQFKTMDNRHLYTLTSNFDHPLHPVEDYQIAFMIQHYKARIQFLHDEVAESTTINYNEMAENVPVPFTSFEVGQYCVYPDVDSCEKYTGNMMPVNFDIIRKMMQRKGVYDRLQDYIAASGDMAAKLYKEDIEAVLRTPSMGGFQLLAFVDYTGQATATVGLLDIFHENKGVISAEDWKAFCCEVVPLFEARRIFTNTETLTAKVWAYDHGDSETPIDRYSVEVLSPAGTVKTETLVGEGKLDFAMDLSAFTENTPLTVKVSAEKDGRTYTNSWRLFVYKAESTKTSVPMLNSPEELKAAEEQGGLYIASPACYPDRHLVKNAFIPVFWSPVWFPKEGEKPYGAIIKKDHDALKAFPTEKYPDYQWKSLFEKSVCMEYRDMGVEQDVIVEMVPNFIDNTERSPLFAYKAGKATILFCGIELDGTRPEEQALRESLAAYIAKAN